MTNATITVTGNLGQTAELKTTPSGRPVLSFSIAHTPRRKNAQGEWEDADVTQWYRGTLWGREAELYADILVKGQVGAVTITGDLKPSIFEGSNGPRLSLDVAVHSIGVREPRTGGVSRTQGQVTSQPSTGYGNVPAPAGGSTGDPWAVAHLDDEPPF